MFSIHAQGGVVAKDGPLTGFALAGYTWDVNPVCNLYNQSGLPAVPFACSNDSEIGELNGRAGKNFMQSENYQFGFIAVSAWSPYSPAVHHDLFGGQERVITVAQQSPAHSSA